MQEYKFAKTNEPTNSDIFHADTGWLLFTTDENLVVRGDCSKQEATAALNAHHAKVQQLVDEANAKEAADAAARAAAIAHAKSLGFTDEMIAVMYPGLTV